VVRSSSFAGIILAAGSSSRMGADKALLQFAGKTFLAAAIDLLQSQCDFVIVVAGANAKLLRAVVYSNSAYLVENPSPELGQFSSLRIGLRAILNRGRDAACVTLVDRPAAEFRTLTNLKESFLQTSPEIVWATVPEYEGRHGHPVIFAREMIEAFLRAEPTKTARAIEHEHQSHIQYLPVDDPRVAMNINTPEEYSSFCHSTK
jgi:molybdenum cofactor cytidylyltransferase